MSICKAGVPLSHPALVKGGGLLSPVASDSSVGFLSLSMWKEYVGHMIFVETLCRALDLPYTPLGGQHQPQRG